MGLMRLLNDPLGHFSNVDRMVRDPYGLYADIRSHGTVAKSLVPAVCVATGHTAVRQALRQLVVEPPNPAFAWESPVNPSLLSLDPPGSHPHPDLGDLRVHPPGRSRDAATGRAGCR